MLHQTGGRRARVGILVRPLSPEPHGVRAARQEFCGVARRLRAPRQEGAGGLRENGP